MFERPVLYLLEGLITWFLFLTLNFSFMLLRNIVWIFNGTYRKIRRNRRPENYGQCAQVLQVLGRFRVDDFVEARLSDYILIHNRFESPEFVLRDDVTFLTLTDSQAIFVQRRMNAEPAFNHNFFVAGQCHTADKIIIIPLNHFHTLAESTQADEANLIFLHNQARCGGTLACNIFQETERCITFNEPHTINALCKYIFIYNIWNKDEKERIFKNTIKMLCKPYHGTTDKTLAYIMKPTALSLIADLVAEHFPDAIQLFLYRHPIPTAISMYKVGASVRTFTLLNTLPNVPGMISPLFKFSGYAEVDFRGWTPRHMQDLEFGYRIVALSQRQYLASREKGIKITGIKYEDLTKYPQSIIRQMFNICKIPDKLIPLAVGATSKDSQSMMVFSQRRLSKLMPNPPKPTPAFMESAHDMSKEFNIPSPDVWNESYRLPGSLIP